MRIERGAYANLVLPGLLDRSGLSRRDRAFATELVYGTTRRRRACDWLLDPHVHRPLDDDVRAALRLGAYQLAVAGTSPHAAVDATVESAPPRARGLVNAVLRRVASALPPKWPDIATELSYPDWVVDRLITDLGEEAALAALAEMNLPAPVTERDDGYVQDLSSQWVAALVEARAGERVLDMCAAPGGKATAIAAARPALVIAADLQPSRARLVSDNATRLSLGNVATVVADGRRLPVREGEAHRVLVDAPCSGLGALRRRPDARWRIRAEDVPTLARLQRQLLEAAVSALGAGGSLVYSACTLTRVETLSMDEWLVDRHPELVEIEPPAAPWSRCGRGALLLPQTAGTDGMYVLRLRRRRD